jgi:hypothetical protein
MSYITTDMVNQFRDHSLIIQVALPNFQVFRMQKPNTRVMSMQLSFSPEGIALQGDVKIEGNGSCSCFGYGLDWFASKLSGSYLCEKFLQHEFVPEIAIRDLRDPKGHWKTCCPEGHENKRAKDCNAIADMIEAGELGPERVWELLDDDGMDVSDGIPGYAYNPVKAGWLCIIQMKFRELLAPLLMEKISFLTESERPAKIALAKDGAIRKLITQLMIG